MQRRGVVGVMGSGDEAFDDLSTQAGRVIARGGWHLLTGGGGGVMEAVARAFTRTQERLGLSIGILRAASEEHLEVDAPGRCYASRGPNPYVELSVPTHLPYSGRRGKHALSRNHINVLTADAVVVLPGGAGTASELELALEYGRPVALLLDGHAVDGDDADALTARHGDRIQVARGETDLLKWLQRHVAGAADDAAREGQP